MVRDRALAVVSGAQLVVGVVGMAVAVRRRHPYDVPFLHGSPDTVARDTVVMGTALSAPFTMLVAQGVATAVLLRGPSPWARRALGALGTSMIAGYLGERHVRRRLRPSGWEPVESPVAVAGVALAAGMAVLGLAR